METMNDWRKERDQMVSCSCCRGRGGRRLAPSCMGKEGDVADVVVYLRM